MKLGDMVTVRLVIDGMEPRTVTAPVVYIHPPGPVLSGGDHRSGAELLQVPGDGIFPGQSERKELET